MSDKDDDRSNARRIYGAGMYRGLDLQGQIMTPRQHEEAERALTATARKVFDLLPANDGMDVHEMYAAVRSHGMNMRKDVCHGCLKALVDSKLAKLVDGKYVRLAARKSVTPMDTTPRVVRVQEDAPEPAPVHEAPKVVASPATIKVPKAKSLSPFGDALSVALSEQIEKQETARIEQLAEELNPLKENSVAKAADQSLAPNALLDKIANMSVNLRAMADDMSVKMKSIADDLDNAALDMEQRIQAIERDTEKLRQLKALLTTL